MSLKIVGWRKITKWAIWGTLALLFAIFFVKVVTYETWYYDAMDGSERAMAETVAEEQETELIEEKPTDDEIYEYVVAPDMPRYLSIDKLGIRNARILPMGVNVEGELDTPINIFDTGWYEASGKPGQGGTMIIDGHNGGPHVHGVFKDLPDLVEGDIIRVERGDGMVYEYAVVESNAIPLEESDAYMAVAARSPEPGRESVSIITCTGEWSQQQRTYLSRQFVRAVIVE